LPKSGLSDIFAEITKLNTAMQDCVQRVTGPAKGLRDLKAKLELWKRKMEDSKIHSFPRIKHSSGC
jgi:hypothetical protein